MTGVQTCALPIWGALQGGAQILERLCRGKVRLPGPLAWAGTFLFFTLSLAFFRADSVGQALALLGRLFQPGWALPSREFISTLLLKVMREALGLIQCVVDRSGAWLMYWVPLLLIPAGLGLLACPGPVAQAKEFRPSGWRLALTAACLAGSVLLFSGVDTFIYANF